jgi:hypothetical protein
MGTFGSSTSLALSILRGTKCGSRGQAGEDAAGSLHFVPE